MKRKRKKTDWTGRIILLVALIGIGASMYLLLRPGMYHPPKPKVEKRSALREKRGVVLYFSDEEEEYLIGERREISRKGDREEEAKELIAELIKGPKGKLIPTVPPRTRLLTLKLREDGMARVDFDESLSRDHPGGSSSEMMTIYSIVNSLTLNFPDIKRVQILIDGKEIETITGHLSLKNPFSSNPGLIKGPGKGPVSN